ncbi:MAG: transcriptional repressor [Candidatus Aminicenantes bacterium]|jgi:Fur family ferric uptake transcriptional regulator
MERHRNRRHFRRWTGPREAILQLLSRTTKHMSAKEIYASLHKLYPGIGLTTVYRTLDLLFQMGLIQKLSFGDGHNRYEFISDEKTKHHHHLICTSCGKIFNYSEFVDEELALVKKTEERLEKKYNFQIEDHNIEFMGICEVCQKEKGRTQNANRRTQKKE